jgi:hypothetical protein
VHEGLQGTCCRFGVPDMQVAGSHEKSFTGRRSVPTRKGTNLFRAKNTSGLFMAMIHWHRRWQNGAQAVRAGAAGDHHLVAV